MKLNNISDTDTDVVAAQEESVPCIETTVNGRQRRKSASRAASKFSESSDDGEDGENEEDEFKLNNGLQKLIICSTAYNLLLVAPNNEKSWK